MFGVCQYEIARNFWWVSGAEKGHLRPLRGSGERGAGDPGLAALARGYWLVARSAGCGRAIAGCADRRCTGGQKALHPGGRARCGVIGRVSCCGGRRGRADLAAVRCTSGSLHTTEPWGGGLTWPRAYPQGGATARKRGGINDTVETVCALREGGRGRGCGRVLWTEPGTVAGAGAGGRGQEAQHPGDLRR